MDAWSRSLERLEAEFPPEDVHTWLKPLQADLRVDSLVLYAPNAFIVDQVRELYLARIRELLAHFAGFSDVFLEIGSRPRPVEAQNAPVSTPSAQVSSEPQVPFAGNLDNHYTFANFVEGRSNQLGLAAAFQAAQKPGDRAHNPLLLYGGTGLGKTHLMFAAGNAMRQANPGAKVLYLRSEQFFSAMIRALQEKTMDQFKRQFQQVDALLIDSFSPDEFGGTGKLIDVEAARRLIHETSLPVIVAGGLTPDNVGAVVRALRPFAVDVSSGVEEEPGIKSPDLIAAFVAAVREADDSE